MWPLTCGVRGERFRAARGVGALQRAEEIQLRHLRINDDEPLAGQPHDEIWLGVALFGLFAKVAVGAHAGGFDHATQVSSPNDRGPGWT